MACIYQCNNALCMKQQLAPQPNRYTVVPADWWWREKVDDAENPQPQMHACSKPCMEALLMEGFEGWREIGVWRGERGAGRPKVGPENCKVCKRAGQAKCIFHKKLLTPKGVVNG